LTSGGGNHAGGLRVGDQVRVRAGIGGDVLTLALAGQLGRVDAIAEDVDGRVHVGVVLVADPGASLGLDRRRPGHRFYFAPGELEPVAAGAAGPRALIAGIGNVFLGDDGFGVAVAERLHLEAWPPGVRVVDYGIRGLDLVYALLGDPDLVVLVDAAALGAPPGTVSLVLPELSPAALGGEADGMDLAGLDPHDMHPLRVLRHARAMGAPLRQVLLVACEPASCAAEQEGLSPPVRAAIDPACALVREVVDSFVASFAAAASSGA
jgi:hydrogenase maturation protease